MDVGQIALIAVDCGINLHQRVGPGLLKSAYETVLAHALEQRGLSVERLSAVHAKQVLTYLRFLDLPLGLLMNFGGETFKEGLQRVVNHHGSIAGSALRIHQPMP